MLMAYLEGRLQTLKIRAGNGEYNSLCMTSCIELKQRGKKIAVIWPEWSMTIEHCCSYGNYNDGTAKIIPDKNKQYM